MFRNIVLVALVLVCATLQWTSGLSRERRSPFKKHKIVVTEAQQGDGWGAPPPPPQNEGASGWGAPPPPPPAQETIVEHHHHWEGAPPAPPPPPSSHSHSLVINVSKGGGKIKDDTDKLKQFKADVDSAFEEIERDKQDKLDKLKKDAEEKLDALAQIPHMIAGDIEFIGKKIAEDIQKKEANKGISIQIWKGKGKGTGQTSASSSEEVHHHHYYPPPPPPPPRTTQPPPPPPPRRQNGGWGWGSSSSSSAGWEQEAADGLYKIADAGAQFMDFLAGGGGFKGDQGTVESSEGQGWGQGQGQGGKGKGFRLSVWKSKGFRR